MKTPPPRLSYVSLVLRVLIGVVLIYSGGSKALAPSAEFAAALAAYRILPHAFIPPLAQAWPWIELLTGVYIFFGFYTRFFAGVSAGMFGIFLGVLGSALLRGIDPGSCGCFGIGITLPIKTAITLDAAMVLVSALLTYLAKSSIPLSVDGWISQKHY